MKMLGQSATLLSPFDSQNLKNISDELTVIDEATPIPSSLDPKKVVIISKSLEPKDVIAQAVSKGVRHIVQIGHGDVENELLIASSMILNRGTFLKKPLDSFNIKGQELRIKFNSITQKDDIKNKIYSHIQPIPPLRTLADAVLLIADEMIMNAVFDASGNINRDKNILPDGKQGEILISYDNKKMLVACQDPFGSIEDAKLMNRLNLCYEGEQADINFGSGGAGIGCRMMFENSVAMYFAAIKNIETLTCCVLPVDQGLKATLRMPKNLHISI